jgi:gliding motility-associated-like protein
VFYNMPFMKKTILVFVALISSYLCSASHTTGGGMTYVYTGSSGGVAHYTITLETYIDCLNGNPESIAQDDPAYFGIYDGHGTLVGTDSAFFSSVVSIPASVGGACGATSSSSVCVTKRTYIANMDLSGSTSGYTIVYQRCCRNSVLTNIVAPSGNFGCTYYCTIPPSIVNNSAVFTNTPPVLLALDRPFSFDFSASDADGDSLSYELSTPLDGATTTNIKPFPPAPPPYDSVPFVAPLSSACPMHCSVPLAIDPVTGMMTATPDIVGCYQIAVACHEWRAGVMISTIRREYEFTVLAISSTSYKPVAGRDTTIFVGDSVQFEGAGAASYTWTPSAFLSSTTISDPVGHFTAPGLFTYVLHGISDSGCTGTDTILVNVLEHSEFLVPNAFTPNNDGHNDVLFPIPVKSCVLEHFRVYNDQMLEVYDGSGPGAGWDGKYHGTLQGIGNYFWVLTYTDNAGKHRQMRGNVTLIR